MGPTVRRWLLGGARLGARAFGRLHALANELPVVLHDPALERQCIEEHYRDRRLYQDPGYQIRGLWPFEERAVQRFFPPPPARVLIPGAGTGREALALHRLGYRVTAFEPTPAMVDLANQVLVPAGAPEVLRRGLQEWMAAPDGSFDAVLGGWAMWTHILRHQDRIDALAAFRAVNPAGPVLLSFDRREPYADHTEAGIAGQPLYPAASDRLSRFTRVLLRERLLGRPPIERGTGFRNGVFVHWVDEPELTEEAAASGYRVAYYERDGSRYPHAVLVPGG
jgi:SAM-dependent methyltransferase